MAIRVYQTFFSALMPSACKFYPSCSKYAATAVQLHGARHGSWLALKRLARCHPFTRGGVEILRAIEARQYDVLSGRPTISSPRKAMLLLHALVGRFVPGMRPAGSMA